jgi:hypothetical protein
MADKEHRHSYGEDGICHCGESFDTEIDALKAELATEKLVAQKAREHIDNLLSLLDQVGLSAWRTPPPCSQADAHLSEECPNCANPPHAGPCARSHAKDGPGNRTPNAEDFYQSGNGLLPKSSVTRHA